MLFLAFVIGIIWTLKEAPSEGIEPDHLYEVFIIIIALALLGSRLAFVWLNWGTLYRGQPWWKIFAFREGGLTFYGGLLAALLGGLFYTRYRKISFLKHLDFITPFIALGYAITRIGCFLNGCCYGRITSVPWGIVFPAVDNFPRHPTQLYASASALLIFFMLRHLRKFKHFPGFLFIWFIVLYGVYRFAVEFFRVSEIAFWVLSQAQLVAVVFVIAGLAVLFWQKQFLPNKR
jgi:phosphatidylglycerol:prolipoprotein diacylglycerol transferase